MSEKEVIVIGEFVCVFVNEMKKSCVYDLVLTVDVFDLMQMRILWYIFVCLVWR